MSAGRRILVWSQRGLHTAPFRCVGYEFEDVIAAVEPGAALCTPTALLRPPSNRLVNLITRDAGVRIPSSAGYRRPKVEGSYDLFFADFQFLVDLDSLRAIPDRRSRARHSVCVIEESWARDIPKWKSLPRLLDGFDHVFLECAGTVDAVHKATGIPCSYLPPAVDALRFCPDLDPGSAPTRVVDVCHVGRRDQATHATLLAAYTRGEVFYEFDTVRPEGVWDVVEHREHLAGILKRSRYVLVNPGKYNRENETSGQQEVGFRFFEGAAAGTVMIGGAPQTPAFAENFGWTDSVIADAGAPVLDIIRSLDEQPGRVDGIRRDNIANSLLRHDWVYRWEKVLDSVGMPLSSAGVARKRELAASASRLRAGAPFIDLPAEHHLDEQHLHGQPSDGLVNDR